MRSQHLFAVLPILLVGCSQDVSTGRPLGENSYEVKGGGNSSGDSAHGTSSNLREVTPLAPESGIEHHEKPNFKFAASDGLAPDASDPVAQTSAAIAAAVTPGLSFAGVGNGDYGFKPDSAPPDTNGAVGATQYVQWVNESFAVFDKVTGALIYGPAAGNTLFQSLGGPCAANNDGDPIAQYDKAANRWVLTQFSVTNGSSQGYLQCVAVSQTSDATGAYNLYAFRQPNFNDYPKLGVWPDAYYATYNIYSGNNFRGARVCAMDRTAMLAGGAATQVCFQLSSSFDSLLPSDLDGMSAPPAGSPNILVNFGTNSLNVWKFHTDFATPANATLSGPISIPVAAFSPACGGGVCIPQPSTSQQLDSLGDRLMYRLAYRNFADHEAMVVTHSVRVSGSRRSQVVGVRWYELRNPSGGTLGSGTPLIYQQGTFSPDSTSRWMASAAMDKVGNIAVGYSASSSSVYPSLRYSVHQATDLLGQLERENTILSGHGSQKGNHLDRWGDYSAMTVDPVDDCTFWYTNEYEKKTGSYNWSTYIASFKLPTCQ